MAKRVVNNLKLGFFVIAGLAFLVVLLYMLGKNKQIFGSSYELKAYFSDVSGLVKGNNVRFSGIQVGTVKSIDIINDTTIQVNMTISKKMEKIIHQDAIASVGTEGLVGNKVLNIVPGKSKTILAKENDVIASKSTIDTDQMLNSLYKSNENILGITNDLKTITDRINRNNGLWELLADKTLPNNIKSSLINIQASTVKVSALVDNINSIVYDVKHNKGTMSTIIYDTIMSKNMADIVLNIKKTSENSNELTMKISKLTTEINHDWSHGIGTFNSLVKDTIVLAKLNATLENLKQGTDGFNQNMDALKRSIFFRRHFEKLDKGKKDK